MGGIEFVNDLCCNYLTIPYGGSGEDFALRMMTENETAAFLPVELRRLDGQTYLYYNISGAQNMEILYGETPMDRKVFQTFMWQLREAMEESGELFLAGDGICLEPCFLFWELGAGRWKFLYIPGQDTREPEEAQRERENLAEFLVMHMDYEDKELADTVYRFYEEVCAGINFPWRDTGFDRYGLKTGPQKTEEWKEGKGQGAWKSGEQEITEETEIENAEPENKETEREAGTVNDHENKKGQTIFCIFLCAAVAMTLVSGRVMPETTKYGLGASTLFAVVLFVTLVKKKGRKAGCGKETYETATLTDTEDEDAFYNIAVREEQFKEMRDAAEERTVYMEMQSSQEKKLYGAGKYRRQKIFLERMPCLIGKDSTLADHVIADPTVSRMHAKFSLEGETVWMQDLNSTNGTYHNGMRLTPNEKVALESEDEVAFGQAQFVFR